MLSRQADSLSDEDLSIRELSNSTNVTITDLRYWNCGVFGCTDPLRQITLWQSYKLGQNLTEYLKKKQGFNGCLHINGQADCFIRHYSWWRCSVHCLSVRRLSWEFTCQLVWYVTCFFFFSNTVSVFLWLKSKRTIKSQINDLIVLSIL